METIALSDGSDEELHTSESSIPPYTPKSSKITVEIRSRSKYVPGTGPRLQSVRLLPRATSTGYIIGRILLPSPGPAADGKPLPMRMTYIVGWHDLPAASLLVPAMEILQYVSPRNLEVWEARLEDQMDEDRQNEAELDKQVGRGVNRTARPRPPRHTNIEQLAAIMPESKSQRSIRPMNKGISLSTPRKRKLADFEGLSDEENSASDQIVRELTNMYSNESSTDAWDDDERCLRAAVNDVVDQKNITIPIQYKRPMKISPVPLPPFVLSQNANANAQLQNKKTTITSLGMHNRPELSTEKEVVLRSVEVDASSSGTPASYLDLPSEPSAKEQEEQQIAPTINDEPVWEVQRIEDMAVYDVDGRGYVRYFLVRWAGDWPPEQNPSWEPEENIPAELVRNYMRQGKKRRAQLAARHRRRSQKQQGFIPEQRYSNVSKAFEGGSAQNLLSNEDTGTNGKETPVPLPPSAFFVF